MLPKFIRTDCEMQSFCLCLLRCSIILSRVLKLTRFVLPVLSLYDILFLNFMKWWARSDLNRRPADYESDALTN